MSGPHFEQLRTRLKGLGLGRVGMKKLKIRTREEWCENFAQGTIHPPKCKIRFFQMAITSSFQIQIAHRLKYWTPEFLRFKRDMVCIIWAPESAPKTCPTVAKWGAAATFPFSFAQSSSNGHNFFVSTPNRAPFEPMDSWLPKLWNEI